MYVVTTRFIVDIDKSGYLKAIEDRLEANTLYISCYTYSQLRKKEPDLYKRINSHLKKRNILKLSANAIKHWAYVSTADKCLETKIAYALANQFKYKLLSDIKQIKYGWY